MLTTSDITIEESQANFLAKSMLNRRDIVHMLDEWRNQIVEGKLRIQLCDRSVNELKRIIQTMRGYVMTANVPDISANPSPDGMPYRYVFDWYRSGLQLGVERFDPTDRFLPDGTPALPDPTEHFEPCTGDEPAQEETVPRYIVFHAVHAKHVSLAEWAEANQVKIDTARQWVKRERIQAEKDNGSRRVSLLQYTPDAVRQADSVVTRMKFPGPLPEDITKEYPLLSGTVADAMIAPNEDDPDMFRIFSVHRYEPSEDGLFSAEQADITRKQRDALLSRLDAADGVRIASDQAYRSPFRTGSDRIVHAAQMTRPARKRNSACPYKASGTVKTIGQETTDREPESAIACELTVTPRAGGETIKITGRYCLYDMSAEQRLLYAIFGWPDITSRIAHVISEAGIQTGLSPRYPWDKNVLIIDGIPDDAPMDVIQELPGLVRNALCLDPSLILIDKKKARFREIGFVPAGEYLYAYVPEQNRFLGFKEKTPDKSN